MDIGLDAGSLVMLRSGGPPMTVLKLARGKAFCAWFDASDRESRAWFELKSLKRVAQ